MRTKKTALVGLAAALPLATLVAQPASAAQGFHGTFTGYTVHVGCTTPVTESAVSGNWNVVLAGADGATPTVRMFEDGKMHVAYGGVALGVFHDVTQPGQEFSIQTTVSNGATLTMTLVGHAFSYVITPYDLFGLSCSSVTISGVGD